MPSRIEIIGMRSGKWTVLRNAPSEKRQARILCQCDCGTQRVLAARLIREGVSKSCGCVPQPRRFTHGMSRSAPYKTWGNMISRCQLPTNSNYRLYGGRGIAVAPEWQTFEGFWKDMGPTWFEGGTLERDDVNGGYNMPNCRWIPRSEQTSNLQKTIRVETPWGTLHLAEAARRIGISAMALRGRMRRGLTGEDLLAPPRWSTRKGKRSLRPASKQETAAFMLVCSTLSKRALIRHRWSI